MDSIKLGSRIRDERLKLRLTQEKLAEDIGISDSYLGQLERGERSLTLETLVKLANRFSVTIDFLMQDSVLRSDEMLVSQWIQLMDGCSKKQKQMIIDVIKVMIGYLNE